MKPPCKDGRHKWHGAKCAKCGSARRKRGRPPRAVGTATAPPASPVVDEKTIGAAIDAAEVESLNAALAAADGSGFDAAADGAEQGAGAGQPAAVEVVAAAGTVGDAEDQADVASTARWMARRLTRMVDAGSDWAVEKLAKRMPGDSDEEDIQQFENAVARGLRKRWNDGPLSPLMQGSLALAFMVGGKCLTSSPIPKKPALVAVPQQPEEPSPERTE